MAAAPLTINQVTDAPLNNEVIIAQYGRNEPVVYWVTNYGRAGEVLRGGRGALSSYAPGPVRLSADIITAVKAIYEHPETHVRAARVVIDAYYAGRTRLMKELERKRNVLSTLEDALAAMNPSVNCIANNAECMSFGACKELVRAVREVDDAWDMISTEISGLEQRVNP